MPPEPRRVRAMLAPLLVATTACIPDVNVTGERGEGGSTSTGSGVLDIRYVNNGAFVTHQSGHECLNLKCPPGLRALAGGGAWGDQISVDTNRPTADDTWTLCGYAPDASQSWNVEAICGDLDTQRVSQTANHPGGHACLTATCPAGMKAIGGGGEWDAGGDPTGIRLDGSRPSADDTWQICGHRPGAATVAWTVEAVCAAVGAELVTESSDTHPGGDQCLTAFCPGAKVAIGGGADWNVGVDDDYTSNALRPAVDRWSVCVRGVEMTSTSHDWLVQLWCL